MTKPSNETSGAPDPTLPPPVLSPPPAGWGLRWGAILRDIALLFLLTSAGGFVVGMVTGGPQRNPQTFMIALAVTNILLMAIGFTIVGILAAPNRWPHLALVAVGAWLTGLVGVAAGATTLPAWLGGAIFVAVLAVLGGWISHVFRRDAPRPEER